MSNETTVLALFEEANPVPDEQTTDEASLEPAAYLATLQRRSSEVTRLDEETRKETGTNRSWLMVATAAVLAIIAGVAIVLLNQGTDTEPPVATNAPPTTTPGQVTTTIPESATTLDEAEAEWQAIPVWNDTGISAYGPPFATTLGGTYRTSGYRSPFAYTSQEGWLQTPPGPVGGDSKTSFVIQLMEIAPLRIIALTTPLTVEEVVEEYAAAHDAYSEAEMSEAEPVEIGGATGMRFESVGLPFQVEDPSTVPFVGDDYLIDLFTSGAYGPPGGTGGESVAPILGAGKALFHVVDVAGVTNLVVYQGIPGHYDENLEAALEFFDSIQWKDAR